jgi:hypothetical protein
LTFAARQDARDRGTLHFRFGQIPGDVFLDNIRILDIASAMDFTRSVNKWAAQISKFFSISISIR